MAEITGLSAREKQIFEILRTGEKVSLKMLADKLSQTSEKDLSAKSVNITVKYLAAKLAAYGIIIEREGGIGRGNQAVYKMRKITHDQIEASESIGVD